MLGSKEAAQYKPGQTGLLALDWWNGNRSVLVDTDLTGMILGMTLLTKPQEIYRTLLEATAFGTRKIVDAFHSSGVNVDVLYACGGLPQKNKLLMQIYADVTNREIFVADSKQTAALGAAIFAAVAADKEAGGYDTVIAAAEKMARVKEETFKPIPENVEVYERLYQEYNLLHDYFGRGAAGRDEAAQEHQKVGRVAGRKLAKTLVCLPCNGGRRFSSNRMVVSFASRFKRRGSA